MPHDQSGTSSQKAREKQTIKHVLLRRSFIPLLVSLGATSRLFATVTQNRRTAWRLTLPEIRWLTANGAAARSSLPTSPTTCKYFCIPNRPPHAGRGPRQPPAGGLSYLISQTEATFCLGERLFTNARVPVFQFHGDGKCRIRRADRAGESRGQLQR